MGVRQEAVEAYGQKLAEVSSLRDAEARMIRECAANHSSMPPGYWEPRFRAEQQLKSLQRILEALAP